VKKTILFLIAVCIFTTLQAQKKGNGNLITQTREITDLSKISVNINGQVNIICGSDESKIEITYDENIVDLVGTKNILGFVVLDQKEWIQGSEEVEITIYTDELKVLRNDSWSKIKITNINQEKLIVKSNISDIYLSGRVGDLDIYSEDSNIYAFDLEAKNVKVKVTEDGIVNVFPIESLEGDSSQEDKIKFKGTPPQISGTVHSSNKMAKPNKIDTRFIDLKFKNVGIATIQAYVKGPKPDGNYFSYGLPFRPMQTRAERWSIGTKLYRVSWLGTRKLLYEVKAADEGQTIKIK